MMWKFKKINGWKAPAKQWDKINLTVRISFFTIIEIKGDRSAGTFRLILLNFGIVGKKQSRNNKSLY